MSVNLSQLLTEARTLVTRLHDRDKLTDTLLGQTHTLNDKIKCMKEYKEDVNDFNETHHPTTKTRTTIVQNLQQENRQIKVLQEENRQLKLALEEHQAALDLIMHRYRQQVLLMSRVNGMQRMTEQAVDDVQSNCRGEELGKLVEFARVVDQCLKIGEENSMRDQEELSRLQTENQTLRQLLKIAAQNDYAAAKTFVDLLRELGNKSSTGNETPKSSDDQHTPTSETVDLELCTSTAAESTSSNSNSMASNSNSMVDTSVTSGRVSNTNSSSRCDNVTKSTAATASSKASPKNNPNSAQATTKPYFVKQPHKAPIKEDIKVGH